MCTMPIEKGERVVRLPCTHVFPLPSPPTVRERFPRAGAMAERAVGVTHVSVAALARTPRE